MNRLRLEQIIETDGLDYASTLEDLMYHERAMLISYAVLELQDDLLDYVLPDDLLHAAKAISGYCKALADAAWDEEFIVAGPDPASALARRDKALVDFGKRVLDHVTTALRGEINELLLQAYRRTHESDIAEEDPRQRVIDAGLAL